MDAFGKFLIGVGVILIGLGVIIYAWTTHKVESTVTETTTGTMTTTTVAGLSLTGDVGIVKVEPAAVGAFTVTLGTGTAPGTTATAWEAADDGFGTKTITLNLTEIGGKEVHITSVTWTLFDATGAPVATGSQQVSTTIAASGTGSVSFDIRLLEGHALSLDMASIPATATSVPTAGDNAGSGRFTFTVAGVDTTDGFPITPIAGAADMTVATP